MCYSKYSPSVYKAARCEGMNRTDNAWKLVNRTSPRVLRKTVGVSTDSMITTLYSRELTFKIL